MSPQVLRDTVIVKSDSVPRHHRRGIICATTVRPEDCGKVLWVVDGEIYDNIELEGDDITGDHPSSEEIIENVLKRKGIGRGKVETFTILPGNDAMSVYPDYGELQGAIIITTKK